MKENEKNKIVIPARLPAGRQSFSGNPELWIPD